MQNKNSLVKAQVKKINTMHIKQTTEIGDCFLWQMGICDFYYIFSFDIKGDNIKIF